jgi:hypothetical protein
MIKIKSIYYKYIFFLIIFLGIMFLSGCRLFRHKHYTKYGPPSSSYKKMSNTSLTAEQTLLNDFYKF